MRNPELTDARRARLGWSILVFALTLGALAVAYQAIALAALTAPSGQPVGAQNSSLPWAAVLVSAALAGVVGGALGWWAVVVLRRAPGAISGALAGLLATVIASFVFAASMIAVFITIESPMVPQTGMDLAFSGLYLWGYTVWAVLTTPLEWGVIIIPIAWGAACGAWLRRPLRSDGATAPVLGPGREPGAG